MLDTSDVFTNFAQVIELDRHIEILLLGNDCVIVPDFGGFMAHYDEARKDENDGCFLPPLRTIGFNQKLILNDSLIAQSYVEAYDISYPEAVRRIEDEVRELRQHLENDGHYELNHIGILKFNEDGYYEFTPCEAGILTPALYGLSNFEMKTLAKILEEQVAAQANSKAAADMTASVTSPTPSTDTIGNKDESSKLISLWRNLAVACIAILLFLLLPSPLANNSKKMLQSKVNTQLLQRILPKDVTTGEQSVKEAVKKADIKTIISEQSTKQEKSEEHPNEGFTIVLASRISLKNATAYVEDLHRRGMKETEVFGKGKSNRVIYGHYSTRQEAYNVLKQLNANKEFAEAWVMNTKTLR